MGEPPQVREADGQTTTTPNPPEPGPRSGRWSGITWETVQSRYRQLKAEFSTAGLSNGGGSMVAATVLADADDADSTVLRAARPTRPVSSSRRRTPVTVLRSAPSPDSDDDSSSGGESGSPAGDSADDSTYEARRRLKLESERLVLASRGGGSGIAGSSAGGRRGRQEVPVEASATATNLIAWGSPAVEHDDASASLTVPVPSCSRAPGAPESSRQENTTTATVAVVDNSAAALFGSSPGAPRIALAGSCSHASLQVRRRTAGCADSPTAVSKMSLREALAMGETEATSTEAVAVRPLSTAAVPAIAIASPSSATLAPSPTLGRLRGPRVGASPPPPSRPSPAPGTISHACHDAAAAPDGRKPRPLSRTISAPVLGGGTPRLAPATPPSPRRLPVLPPKGGGSLRGNARKLAPLGGGGLSTSAHSVDAAASRPSSRPFTSESDA